MLRLILFTVLHEARPTERLPPGAHSRGWKTAFNTGSFWVFGHAFWSHQCPLSGVDEWCPMIHAQSVYLCLYRSHFNFFWNQEGAYSVLFSDACLRTSYLLKLRSVSSILRPSPSSISWDNGGSSYLIPLKWMQWQNGPLHLCANSFSANFCRHFIHNYSNVVTCLTSTLRHFLWSVEAEAVFSKLKMFCLCLLLLFLTQIPVASSWWRSVPQMLASVRCCHSRMRFQLASVTSRGQLWCGKSGVAGDGV